jgi:hypothetical protein
MHINEVKTAVKVGDFVLRKGNRNKIGFQYSSTLDKKNSF